MKPSWIKPDRGIVATESVQIRPIQSKWFFARPPSEFRIKPAGKEIISFSGFIERSYLSSLTRVSPGCRYESSGSSH